MKFRKGESETEIDFAILNLPEGALSELLYADDLVLMNETIEELRNKIIKYEEAIETKGLKVNLGETKVMVGVASQSRACLKVKLIHVGSAA